MDRGGLRWIEVDRRGLRWIELGRGGLSWVEEDRAVSRSVDLNQWDLILTAMA